MPKKHILRLRKEDKRVFEYLKDGQKKVETRAATLRYSYIPAGDTLIFLCGGQRLEKKIKNAHIFKSIGAMLKKYKMKDINPDVSSESELRAMYHGFSDYTEKIKKFGLIAFELEK